MRSALGRDHPERVAIVAAELARRRPARYLELGVGAGVVFLHVRAHRKVGVDPAARIPRWKWALHPNSLVRGSFFRVTSERFFDALERDRTFDVIFIDGDHSYEQSRRDVERALAHLALDGVILVHDCNPPTPESASADSANSRGGPWCGEVYKTIVELRATRPELAVVTIAADDGIGVVRRGRGERLALAPGAIAAMTWDELDRDRERLLGLRQPDSGTG
jgi:hypothetical protein